MGGVTGTSYHRALEWNEPPAPAERRYARWTVVRADAAPAPRWLPLARIGEVRLYLSPPGCEHDAPACYVQPVVASKRGRRGSGSEVGLNGQVCERLFFFEENVVEAPPLPRAGSLASWTAAAAAASTSWAQPVSVAVVDVSFDNVEALDELVARSPGAVVQGPWTVGLPTSDSDGDGDGAGPRRPLSGAPGHGTAMAGIVLHEVPGARVGLFEIPALAGAVPPYLGPTSLAAAIATAVEAWRADVVLVAMSDGAWGTPEPLRDVLREAARTGRGGRGAAIFCSVGDPSRNHARDADSAALGADDLASQPWVQAVAACDRDGSWYRTRLAYRPASSVVYNRFGPAVALSALGEPRRFGGAVASDDSSQATALAAAAAARALAANPVLGVDELRALLAITADVAPEVDRGPGLVAGEFDRRDRMGHSLKLGYGGVNARAARLAAADPLCLALLATREVPDPAGRENPALLLAEAWDALAGDLAETKLGAGYLRVRGQMSRLYLRSLAVQDALGWLARHVRALPPEAPERDHGALNERILHAVDACRRGADGALAAWLAALEASLRAADGDRIASLLAVALAPAKRSLDSRGAPQQGWSAGDAVVQTGGDQWGGQA
jgi:hypothetical protein